MVLTAKAVHCTRKAWPIFFPHKPDQSAVVLTVDAPLTGGLFNLFSITSLLCILLLKAFYCSSTFLVVFWCFKINSFQFLLLFLLNWLFILCRCWLKTYRGIQRKKHAYSFLQSQCGCSKALWTIKAAESCECQYNITFRNQDHWIEICFLPPRRKIHGGGLATAEDEQIGHLLDIH